MSVYSLDGFFDSIVLTFSFILSVHLISFFFVSAECINFLKSALSTHTAECCVKETK